MFCIDGDAKDQDDNPLFLELKFKLGGNETYWPNDGDCEEGKSAENFCWVS